MGCARSAEGQKGAIRAAIDILLETLSLSAADLDRVILTGSFGGQVDPRDALELGMLPPVRPDIVESIANGADLGVILVFERCRVRAGRGNRSPRRAPQS